MKMLSVITPCFNESENLRVCIESLVDALPGIEYEHVFIDNFSTDSTLKDLIELKKEFPHLRILSNSQNVGVFSSIQRALRESDGEWVVPFFAADLQDPAEVIRQMISIQKNSNCDSVFAIRETRSENPMIFLLRRIFYGIIRRTTDKAYVSGTSEFCLIKASVASQVSQIDDANPFLRLYLSQLRGDVRYVKFAMKERIRGKSSANLFSLMDDALNAFSIVLPSVFSRILISSFIGILAGTSVCFFTLLDLLFLPFNLEKLFTPALLMVGFSSLIALNALIGQYVYIIHSNVRKRLTASTTEI